MLNILPIAYLHDKLKLSPNYTKSSKPVVGHKVNLKESGPNNVVVKTWPTGNKSAYCE